MEIHQRPGVYTDYTISSSWRAGSGGKAVGLVGLHVGESLITLRTVAQVEEGLSGYPILRRLCQVLLRSGAGSVVLSPAAASDGDSYSAALDLLLGTGEVSLVVLDTEVLDMVTALKSQVEAYSAQGKECLGVVGLSGGTVDTLTARALTLNSPRMVLVGGTPTLSRESKVSGGIYAAAAVAGLLAGEEDPALPISGAELGELGTVGETFTESELDSLILGGVTMLENAAGTVSVVRGVTTCTSIGGVVDHSYLELSTIRIIDDVVPGIRSALKSRFMRKKNNAATRGAIGDQVAVELENRVRREIIEGYEDISVTVSEDDPTVCVVTFGFTVTHGLGRIFLTAHITV